MIPSPHSSSCNANPISCNKSINMSSSESCSGSSTRNNGSASSTSPSSRSNRVIVVVVVVVVVVEVIVVIVGLVQCGGVRMLLHPRTPHRRLGHKVRLTYTFITRQGSHPAKCIFYLRAPTG
eukprot:Filipodium_phascolosomae@DN6715_c0_g1_i2.p1